MQASSIHQIDWSIYSQTKIKDRTFRFSIIDELITSSFKELNWEILGFSIEKRPIRLLKIGHGKTKVLLWSQMHGDEPTATAALFDLIQFFTDFNHDQKLKENILATCSLYIIPVINPDGLERFTRRNAQEIDINRDYLAQQSPEAQILKTIKEQIKPDFAFNLHDQDALYCIPKTNFPVAISLLAPAIDTSLTTNWTREQAMKVIVCINETLQKLVPQQVGRFNDEFEPTAFGDNFQKSGAITILIESGAITNDPEKQEIRKLNFYGILTALNCICNQSYQEKDLINYLMIPIQKKELFHVILKNCTIDEQGKTYQIDIGLNYTEILDQKSRKLNRKYQIMAIGDLNFKNAFEIIDAKDLILLGNPKFESDATLSLKNTNQQIVAEWIAGIRIQ